MTHCITYCLTPSMIHFTLFCYWFRLTGHCCIFITMLLVFYHFLLYLSISFARLLVLTPPSHTIALFQQFPLHFHLTSPFFAAHCYCHYLLTFNDLGLKNHAVWKSNHNLLLLAFLQILCIL